MRVIRAISWLRRLAPFLPALAPLFAVGAVLAVVGATFSFVLFAAAGSASGGSQACEPSGLVGGVKADEVPKELIPIYRAAASKYELAEEGPAYLAGINAVETNFGKNVATSSAGAVGWMQFMPSTWAKYGVDANGDGKRDPDDPQDAIYGSANYLRASGAPKDWHRAIFAYNHADWYVVDVERHKNRYLRPIATSSDDDASFNACSSAEPQLSGTKAQRIEQAAEQLARQRVPYCYGGGHQYTPAKLGAGEYCVGEDKSRAYGSSEVGLDCSSSVSMILQKAGYDIPTMTSGELANWGEAGEGKYVTIYANSEHVYMKIGDRYFGTSQENYRNGPDWHSARDGAGFEARHPPGL